jgi:hypothetical protein
MRARRRLVLSLLLGAACGPVAGRGAPESAPAAAAAPAVDSLRGPWRLRNLDRPQGVTLEMRAQLRSSIDTVVLEDSVASRTQLEWATVPASQPLRLVGMVRDFAVRGGADSGWRAVPQVLLPVTFAAHAGAPGMQPDFETPDPLGCDARAAVVQAFREAWLAPPQALAVGTRWQDSVSYAFCRDGIVLRASGTRRYVVDGAEIHDGRLQLRVLRVSDAAIAGRGAQFGDSVQVTGRGTAQGVLWLSLDGGAIVRGQVRSELHLEMRGRRRTQQLVQAGVLEIRAP